VDHVEAKAESLHAAERLSVKVTDQIRVLPDAALGETNWGTTTLSVANGREATGHSAELGTQTLMGDVVRVLKRQGRWLYVQSSDQYLSWMESGSLKLGTRAEADAWEKAPLLIVTELDGLVREAPEPDAPPISDVVIGCRVKQISKTEDWFKVELPDGRRGYLPKSSATDYANWKQSRQPTPENIERTARQFIGRPYLWGASTPRGMDCSGFTKLTFLLNGIELRRNASQQAQDGKPVPLDRDLSQLKKGDLLFFGFERPGDRPDRISHVGIYLGDKLFIQSSQRVRISSLDPDSPIADPGRIRGLIRARRVLAEN
jgi:cell wall-associated NlpC family hydrolase